MVIGSLVVTVSVVAEKGGQKGLGIQCIRLEEMRLWQKEAVRVFSLGFPIRVWGN